MIRAERFVAILQRAGFRLFTGTPCSYLAPVINRVIDDPDVEYIGAANEGDAVAVAAGAELGGKPSVALFQNSGLGNAVNPLTSLTATFRIPVLLLVTWRGQPGGPADEPQHEVMGRTTAELLRLMDIPCDVVPDSESALAALVDEAATTMRENRLPRALLLKHETVSPYALQTKGGNGAMRRGDAACASITSNGHRIGQQEALAAIQAAAAANDAIVATTGYTGRALYALADRPNQFYMVGSMGCASSFALGLARAQPHRRVIVIDGDGAALMRLGALATIGHEAPPNLLHILLDNGMHESTGGQATASDTTDLPAAAQACGYPNVIAIHDLDELRASVAQRSERLTFLHVRTQPRESTKLPRPTVTPVQVAKRFRQWLKETP
jgi:phosphonopyruvate decarboxylase